MRRQGYRSVVLSGKQINSTNANKLHSRFPGLQDGLARCAAVCSSVLLANAAEARQQVQRKEGIPSLCHFPPVGWARHLSYPFLLAGPEKKSNYSPPYQMSRGPKPQLHPQEGRKRVGLGPDMQIQILSVGQHKILELGCLLTSHSLASLSRNEGIDDTHLPTAADITVT